MHLDQGKGAREMEGARGLVKRPKRENLIERDLVGNSKSNHLCNLVCIPSRYKGSVEVDP